jgi:uncharacterized protein
MKRSLRSLGVGVLLGFALSRIGFSSWDEVHRMFVFADLRLTLTFAASVAVLVVAWKVIARSRELPPADRPLHRGTIPGAILFGVGWAISSSCPAIAFVQLGQGQLGALVAIAGMFAGNAIFAYVNPRVMKVPAAGCLES